MKTLKKLLKTYQAMSKKSERAETAALKVYPKEEGKVWHSAFGILEFDKNAPERTAYQAGYEQSEKDIISLIESRISELLGDAQPTPILRYELQDLIKKIKEK